MLFQCRLKEWERRGGDGDVMSLQPFTGRCAQGNVKAEPPHLHLFYISLHPKDHVLYLRTFRDATEEAFFKGKPSHPQSTFISYISL